MKKSKLRSIAKGINKSSDTWVNSQLIRKLYNAGITQAITSVESRRFILGTSRPGLLLREGWSLELHSSQARSGCCTYKVGNANVGQRFTLNRKDLRACLETFGAGIKQRIEVALDNLKVLNNEITPTLKG